MEGFQPLSLLRTHASLTNLILDQIIVVLCIPPVYINLLHAFTSEASFEHHPHFIKNMEIFKIKVIFKHE